MALFFCSVVLGYPGFTIFLLARQMKIAVKTKSSKAEGRTQKYHLKVLVEEDSTKPSDCLKVVVSTKSGS